jgi:hypothetical protein
MTTIYKPCESCGGNWNGGLSFDEDDDTWRRSKKHWCDCHKGKSNDVMELSDLARGETVYFEADHVQGIATVLSIDELENTIVYKFDVEGSGLEIIEEPFEP